MKDSKQSAFNEPIITLRLCNFKNSQLQRSFFLEIKVIGIIKNDNAKSG